MIPEKVGPPDLEMLLLDLLMMTNTGGLERTEAEFRELFHATGFRLERIVGTGFPPSVLQAEQLSLHLHLYTPAQECVERPTKGIWSATTTRDPNATISAV